MERDVVMTGESRHEEMINSDQCLSIIYLRLYDRWSLSSLKTNFKIDQDTLNRIFKSF